MMKKLLVPVLFVIIAAIFFYPFFLHNRLPIPSDTIIGLYHPFRDLYAKEYPNGIPYKNFLITDPVRQQIPWRFLATELEKQGQLPLWNPYSFAGFPLLANFQSAVFSPLNVLLFILPFAIGWSLLVVLQPLLAGIFLYYYLRHMHLAKKASFLGGGVFAFCGFSTAWLEWGTVGNTALWLPLVLLAIDKIFFGLISDTNAKLQFKIKNYLWPVIFVVSLSFSLFAGHLQTFFYLFVISEVYFIVRWLQHGKKKHVLFFFLILTILFFILTIIQWWPTLQLINLSARNSDQIWQKDGWFIPWQHLIQFVAPDFFGNPATQNYWGTWNYGEMVGYVGILPLIFALFGMFFRKDRKTLFFGTIFFLSLIFALPTVFAKLPFIWHILFISTAQPTRLLFLTDFSLSVLAALGFDYYFCSEKKKVIFYPVLFVGIVYSLLWVYVVKGYMKTIPISAANLSIAKHNLLLPTGFFFIVTMLLIIYLFIIIKLPRKESTTKNKATKFITYERVNQLIAGIFILITFIDLFRFSWKFNAFTQQQYLFPSTAAIAYLQQQPGLFRIMETDSRILPPNFSVTYHLQSLDGYDPLYLERYGELISAIERNKPDIHAPFGFDRIITPTNISSRLINLLGVKYVLSLTDIHQANLKKVFVEGQTNIYRNADAFSRVFLVNTIKKANNKNEAIALLFDKSINLHRTAIVEGWDSSRTNFANGTVRVTKYQADSISITTRSSGGTFLVLTDTFYPTWHVMVDGRQVQIYRTDYDFRGVFIPKGDHTIVFADSLF